MRAEAREKEYQKQFKWGKSDKKLTGDLNRIFGPCVHCSICDFTCIRGPIIFFKLFLDSYLPPMAAFLFLPFHSQNCAPLFSSFPESKGLIEPNHYTYQSHIVLLDDGWASGWVDRWMDG